MDPLNHGDFIDCLSGLQNVQIKQSYINGCYYQLRVCPYYLLSLQGLLIILGPVFSYVESLALS
jgi:hypothetical protein